ncbi:hypothetical protein EDD18DRAFT_1111615 [Armillaria luteobubalina]|uniref:F-box domain-containing protein n=1 Tax=Armillaria luteobubalina TaxID=153913 RepID=A0AA39TF95_9AGAR|nr:hypothetical protein EDD18DRAFT_1111615 [Armillaria luteobubalina]
MLMIILALLFERVVCFCFGIWVALSVNCKRYPTEEVMPRISVLKRWVSSSGRLPLSIAFLFSEYRNAADYQINVFNTILAQLHRCKSFHGRISFDAHGTDSVQRAIDLDIPDVPMLESLTLGSYPMGKHTIGWQRKLYTKIPRLRHLDVDSAKGIASLSVKDMITVKLDSAVLSDLFYIVENATVLEELKVEYVDLPDRVSRHSRHNSRRLDRLFRLDFQRAADTAVNKFIDYVMLSSIKELTIQTTSAWPDVDAFTRFFKRSACSLTQLIIEAPDGDKHGFLLALRQMSSLKKLLDYRCTNWEKLGVARLDHLSVTIITSRLSAAQMKDRRQQMLEVFKLHKKARFKWAIESR